MSDAPKDRIEEIKRLLIKADNSADELRDIIDQLEDATMDTKYLARVIRSQDLVMRIQNRINSCLDDLGQQPT